MDEPRSVSHRIFIPKSKLCEMCWCYDLNAIHPITTKFCTCIDSNAVHACEKLYGYICVFKVTENAWYQFCSCIWTVLVRQISGSVGMCERILHWNRKCAVLANWRHLWRKPWSFMTVCTDKTLSIILMHIFSIFVHFLVNAFQLNGWNLPDEIFNGIQNDLNLADILECILFNDFFSIMKEYCWKGPINENSVLV